tara:strand:+ start:82419 stop:88241 length:5823 start_codon:yes stop_codon:yes gene_type:complete
MAITTVNSYLTASGLNFREGTTGKASLLLDPSTDKVNLSGNFNLDAGSLTIGGNPIVTGSSSSEGDTLATVTARGATTSSNLTLNGNITVASSKYIGIGSTLAAIQFGDGSIGNETADLSFVTNSDGEITFNRGGNAVIIGSDFNIYKDTNISAGHLRLDDTYKIEWGGTNARIDGSNSSDYLRFFTSNTERIRIVDGGDVGIGTTNPQTKLTVGSDGDEDGLEVRESGHLKFKVRPSSSHAYLSLYDSTVNEDIRFNTNGDSWIGGGSLAVGMTDPSTSRVRIKGGTNDASTNALQCIDSSSTQMFYVRNDGVVAVDKNYFYAAASAGAYVQYALRVRGSISNDTGPLVIGNSNGTNFDGDVNFDVNTLFVDSSTNRIGIGTSSPAAPLTLTNVNGGSWNDGIIIDDPAGWAATVYKRNNSPKMFNGLYQGNDNFIWMSAGYSNAGTTITAPRTDAVLMSRPSTDDLQIYLETHFGQNVGIGTTSPVAEINSSNEFFGPNVVAGRTLTVGTTTTGQANLILQSNHQEGTGDVLGGLYFSHPSGQGDAHHIVGAIQSVVHPHSNRALNGGDLAFYTKPAGGGRTTGDAQLYITHSELVGVGTKPQFRFHVNSDGTDTVARFQSTDNDAHISIADNTDIVYIGHDAALDVMSLGFNSSMGSSSNLNIDTAGNVGIGTNNPAAKLHVHDGHIRMSDGYKIDWGGTNVRIDGDNSSDYFRVFTSSTERLRVDTDGSVGIGTTNPSASLDIHGDGADFFLQSNDHKIARIQPRGTSADLDKGLLSLFDTTTEAVRIDSASSSWFKGGNVGIGTEGPNALLHVFSAGNGEIEVERNGGALINLQAQASKGVIGTDSNHQLDLKTNGGVRMTLLTNGNVGIGTNNPAVNLHVESSTSAQFKVGNGTQFVRLYADSDEATILADGSVDMRFYVGGGEKMRLDTAGRLGIGSTSPQGKLDAGADTDQNIFLGRARFGSHVTDYLYLSHYDNATSTSYALKQSPAGSTAINAKAGQNVSMDVNNDPIVFVKGSNSNVGIGTTAPARDLSVTSSSANVVMQLANSTTTYAADNGLEIFASDNDAGIVNRENGYLRFDTNNNERVRITSAGNVGIGTTNPNAELEIASSAATIRLTDSDLTNTFSEIEKAGDYLYFYSRANSSNGGFLFAGDNGTTETEFMRINTAGNVGIGTNNPSKPLHVIGDIKSSAGVVASRVEVSTDVRHSSDENTKLSFETDTIHLETNGSKRLTVDSAGSVGIGTTNPSAHLTIAKTDPKITLYDTAGANSDPNGEITFNETATSENFAIKYNGANDRLEFNSPLDGNTGIMVITRSERVGIGTTNPDYTLTVDAGTTNEIARFRSTDNDAMISIQDNTDAVYVGLDASADIMSLGFSNAFTTGNLSIDAGGQVGVGTTNPHSLLEVSNNSNDATLIVSSKTNATNGSYLRLIEAGTAFDTYGYLGGYIQYDCDGNLINIGRHNVNGTTLSDDAPAISIKRSDGKVGIGTTDPSHTLDVESADETVASFNSTDNKCAIALNDNDTTVYVSAENSRGAFGFQAGLHANNLNIDTGGKVGLGTHTPSERLEVNPDNDSSAIIGRAHVGYVGFSDYAGFSHVDKNSVGNFAFMQAPNGTTFVNCSSSREIRFQSNNYTLAKFNGSNGDFSIATDALYVDASAHSVGIGTSSPSYELHVEGEILAESNMLLGGDGTYGSTYGAIGIGTTNLTNGHHRIFAKSSDHMYFAAATSKGFRFRPNGGATSASAGVTIASDGDVGIGTTAPANKLDVGGGIAIGASYVGVTAPSNGAIIEGYVGIGTSSNSYYPLYVNGTLYATSKYFIIDHPVPEKKEQHKKLLHACIEGPEVAVYFRGKSDLNIIKMPDYWENLVHIDSMTVELTAIGANQNIYVDSIAENGDVTVGSNTQEPLNYFYVVYGERKDVDKLEPEIIDPEYSR